MSITQADIDSLLATTEAATATMPPPLQRASVETNKPPSASVPPELVRILRMRVPIIVRLAERDLPVGAVLKLNIGSILEFDRRADAELDLLVNNRAIGRGAPVKVGENFGLQLTAVGNLESTIQALGG